MRMFQYMLNHKVHGPFLNLNTYIKFIHDKNLCETTLRKKVRLNLLKLMGLKISDSSD